VGDYQVTAAIIAVLLVFVVLQTKHFICDYPLQTLWMLKNKGTYGHPGGIVHSGIHALATITSFLVLTPTLLVGAGIVIGEFLLHYHIDWSKEQIIRRRGVVATDREFWWAIGFDQLLHHLTYIAIAAVLIATAGLALS
jgi:hypothetical protein